MALGQWAETPAQVNQASALKWGTGASDVIGNRNNGMGRDIAPGETSGDVDQGLTAEHYGFSAEDQWASSLLWGYGADTGTSEHPELGGEAVDYRTDDMKDYPTFGQHPVGLPGGNQIRAIDKGSAVTSTSKLVPNDGDGTLYGASYKLVADAPNDAEISDPSQYEMQTSMTQRDKTRSGSQRGGGSASEYDAPVKTRIPGFRIRRYDEGASDPRHAAMLPKAQDQVIRPWWARGAGTGNPADMQPNAMYQSTPYQRTPASETYQGETLSGTPGIDADQDGPGVMYGFTEEDVTY